MPFQKGHPRLGGKKKGSFEARAAFLKITTDQEYARHLYTLAKAGDATISKAIGEWLWGKAKQPVDVTSDGERIGTPVSVDMSKLKPDQIEALFEALGK